jgi:hypothetical protein
VFCGETKSLEAAHIVDVAQLTSLDEDVDIIRKYQFLDFYDSRNGLTLCKPCHKIFDANLCYIDVSPKAGSSSSLQLQYDYFICFSDVVLTSSTDSSHWQELHMKPVTLPKDERDALAFPVPETLVYRKEMYDLYAAKRLEERSDKPFSCDLCGMRTKSEKGLKAHLRTSKKCFVRRSDPSGIRLRSLHTASKKTPTKTRTPALKTIQKPLFSTPDSAPGDRR